MTRLFEYNLKETGWAEATFSNDHQSVSFDVSYLSDPLYDLYEALYRLTLNQSEKELIVFADEPGEHTLILTRQDYLNISIKVFKNDEWEKLTTVTVKKIGNKELIYSDTDNLLNFVRMICDGTDNLLRKWTLSDYKRLWHLYEFPIESFNKIRQPKQLT